MSETDQVTVEELKKMKENMVSYEKVEGSKTMVMNFGPSHPATHGTLRIVIELDGETIVKATPEIGFLHTGFEKLGEHMSYNQFITITDRANYLSPFMNNLAYVLAVEKLLDLEIPPRCQYLRVILAELSRLADHLLCVAFQALDLGAFSILLYAFREREHILDLFELAAGVRMMSSYTRIGGLMADIPEEFEGKVSNFLENLPKTIGDIDKLLTTNRIFVDRTQNIGKISKAAAIDFGLTGPVLRASGVELDIRKSEPYSSYDHFEFEVPIGEHGDVYDRYLVRMEEMRQSIRIIQQAVDGLPGGPVTSPDMKVTLPEKEDVYKTMESLIHHFKMIMDGHGFHPPKGEVYSSIESPNGELGFYIVSDGSNNPYRVRFRPPSLMNYQAFSTMVEGGMVSDIVAVLGSLNIIAGELDR